MDVLIIFRLLGYILLFILPGAWISFSLPIKGLSFLDKFLLAIVLTPLVIIIEFYTLRLMGASFGLTSILLIFINFPVLYLIYKQRSPLVIPERKTIVSAILVFLIIIACLAPLLVNEQMRVYTWESWMQADIIYSLANGNLILEDPDLAGVTLSYPWGGHIYQGILSYIIDTPPVTNYIWLNILWLVLIFGFMTLIVADMGGNSIVQVITIIWLSFGVNYVGNILGPLIPNSLSDAHNVLRWISGDNRYTPWLDKIIAFSQMYFGLGLFIAILYLAVKKWPEESRKWYYLLSTLLLCGLGIIYSVLLPAAFAVVGTRVLIAFIHKLKRESERFLQEIIVWSIIVLFVSAVTYAQTKYLSVDRAEAPLVTLNDLHYIKYETIVTIVIMIPLLLGLSLVFIRFWKTNRDTLLILVIGGLASCVLYVIFNIPWWRNEYKYIFTAVICLAPFPSFAMRPVIDRLSKFTVPIVVVLELVLSAPFAYKVYYQSYYFYTRPGPLADVSQFALRLADEEPLSDILNTIREKTPINSILVLENTDIHYPTITQRQLYVAPAEDDPKPGILVTNDELLTLIKGYPKQLIDERRANVSNLFNSNSSILMERALQKILIFNRPLVLILDKEKNGRLIQWLIQERLGQMIFHDENLELWVIAPNS